MNSIQQAVRPNDLDREAQSGSIVSETSRKRSSNRSSAAGFLGVLVDALDFAGKEGASVVGSVASSSAARVGLAAGDMITSVNGVGTSTASALGDVLSTQHPGDHVTLTWVTPYQTAHAANIRLSRAPDVDIEIHRLEPTLSHRAPKRRGPKNARSPMAPRRSGMMPSGRSRSDP